MAKFRKKPVVIEAVQYGGGVIWPTEFADVVCSCLHGAPHIHTLEGAMRVSMGDWIIKGVHGEFYPCKPNIFEKSYEPVE